MSSTEDCCGEMQMGFREFVDAAKHPVDDQLEAANSTDCAI